MTVARVDIGATETRRMTVARVDMIATWISGSLPFPRTRA
jgi:hypothetical protein